MKEIWNGKDERGLWKAELRGIKGRRGSMVKHNKTNR